MALTPEEVVNQKFTITKFRDGYDLDQVDDFLDSIVEELRQRDQEKSDLEAELAEAKQRIADLEGKLAAAKQGGGDARSNDDTGPRPSVAEQTIVVDPKPAQQAAGDSEEPEHDAAAVKSSAMLQLALELHDKYINEGKTTRDELISKAETSATQLIDEAQQKSNDILKKLDSDREDLRQQINELREFESEYRGTLSSYIQAQLRELEGSPEPKSGPRELG